MRPVKSLLASTIKTLAASLIWACAGWIGAPALADPPAVHTIMTWDESVYENERFGVTTEKVADGVYVLRRIPSWRSMVQVNVTVIINENDVVVVDGGSPAHVENVVKEIKKLTDKPVSTVITTHWH